MNEIFFFLFPSGNIKSKESKRKEDLSIKPRSSVGAKHVSSSRFTVSPANDPHLAWCYVSSWEPLELNPLGLASKLTPTTSHSPRGYFFIEEATKDWSSCSQSWTHSRFYQRQDFVWQGLLCSCLPLFTEFYSLSLWKRQHMLGEEEPGAL